MHDDMQRDDSIIWFEEGIIGVPRARRFQLLERAGVPIRVLRCLDIEGFNLPVIDPTLADGGYAPPLSRRVLRALQLEAGDPVLLLAVTTRRPDGDLVNLRAPLVVNLQRRLAQQVILDDRAYPIAAPLARPDEARHEPAATLRAPST